MTVYEQTPSEYPDGLLSRPDTATGRLQRALFDVLWGPKHYRAEPPAVPTDGRTVFYEMEHLGHVTKPPPGAKKGRTDVTRLSEASMVLRLAGLWPWAWWIDETRHTEEWGFRDTVYLYAVAAVAGARIDCWAGALPPALLCESRALVNTLRATAERYLCPIAALNGMGSGSQVHNDLIPLLAGRRVLYFGDLDLSGGHIEANVRRQVEAEVGALDWQRVAITAEQVAERGLEPISKTDNRTKPPLTYLAWEAEALEQSPTAAILADLLAEMVPEPIEDVESREQEQRDRMAAALAEMDA